MAEDNQNEQSKTEDPTQKRLEQAFDEGQIAFSREIVHWTVLATSGALLLWVFPHYSRSLLNSFKIIFSSCGDEAFSQATSSVYPGLFYLFFENIAYLFVIVVLVLLVGLSQTRLNFTLTQIAPKLERISPKKGLDKIIGKQGFVEFLKNLLKVTIVGCVMVWSLSDVLQYITLMPTLPLASGFELMSRLFSKLFIAALSILGLIALLDYIYQRFTHWKRLKMSHQEIKDEMKEQEGSPEIKAKLRQLRIQRMRARVADNVKSATVVITNPTHYAVAVRWDEATMETPRVVAKGTDYLALQIRKLAKEGNIPIVENPPLARSLYDKVDLDRDIEPEHYRAVAEIIKYVTELQNKWFK